MDEVESEREYDGHSYSLGEALAIVILGSLCGLKNVSQIHQWAESERAREWLKEKLKFLRHGHSLRRTGSLSREDANWDKQGVGIPSGADTRIGRRLCGGGGPASL